MGENPVKFKCHKFIGWSWNNTPLTLKPYLIFQFYCKWKQSGDSGDSATRAAVVFIYRSCLTSYAITLQRSRVTPLISLLPNAELRFYHIKPHPPQDVSVSLSFLNWRPGLPEFIFSGDCHWWIAEQKPSSSVMKINVFQSRGVS